MSRSKHTRPASILASERVRAPHEPRAKDDASAFHQLARSLKEDGIVLDMQVDTMVKPALLPRVITKRPRQGFIHPASKPEILSVLQFFGASCFYGLRTITLMQGRAIGNDANLSFGRLEVPGNIVIYEQPDPPWFVNGALADFDKAKLIRSGAVLEMSPDNLHSLIHWTAHDLKWFMLFEVFMHEVGHHLIQQYKGKRNVRVVRTKDHELFADLFAQRCRENYLAEHAGNLNA